MKTKTIQIYEFNELSESAQESALNEVRQGNYGYDWFEYVYEDAETIGLHLTGFDLDRNRHAKGNFKDSAECWAYLADRFNTIEKAPLNEDGELESEYNLDSDLNDLDAEFLRSILEDYAMQLQKESEYLDSKEHLLEMIDCNGYTFTEYGKIENI